MVNGIRKINIIQGLEDGKGRWVINEEGMGKFVADYFCNLFTASDDSDTSHIFDNMDKKVLNDMNAEFLRPFHKEVIWLALKDMSPTKALKMDGFPALFY